MSNVNFTYLSHEDVVKSGGLDMLKAISDVEEVLIMRHRGECIVPHKVVLRKGTQEEESVTGRINALPGYLGKDKDIGGIKWVASFVNNPHEHKLPRSSSLIILNSFKTGMPLAIMDGTIISAMRTGAVAGIACKHLAKEGATRLGMVGAGVIGRTVLMAVKATVDIREVDVYAIHREHKNKVCKRDAGRARSIHQGCRFCGTSPIWQRYYYNGHTCQAAICKGTVGCRGIPVFTYVRL